MDGVTFIQTPPQNWPEPEPWLTSPEAMPDVFSDQMGRFVETQAAQLNVPPEYIVSMMLPAVVTATIGRGDVRVDDHWKETITVFMAASGDPGVKKSAVLKAIRGPLDKLQVDAFNEQLPAVMAKKGKVKELKKKAQNVMKKYGADDADEVAIDNELALLSKHIIEAENEIPPDPRSIRTDVTNEAAVAAMQRYGGFISLFAAEGEIINIVCGKYSQKSDGKVYNRAYDGEKIGKDRVREGGVVIDVERPVASISFLVQPSIVTEMLTDDTLIKEGTAARFFISDPAIPIPNGEQVQVPYGWWADQVLRPIFNRFWEAENTPVDIGLTVDTKHRWHKFVTAWDTYQISNMAMWPISAGFWRAKMTGRILRTAAIFALIENPRVIDISERHITAAASFCDWASNEYDRVASVDENATGGLPNDIVRWLVESEWATSDLRAQNQPDGAVSLHQINVKFRRRSAVKNRGGLEALTAAANDLQARGVLQEIDGAPSDQRWWWVRPDIGAVARQMMQRPTQAQPNSGPGTATELWEATK